MFSMNLKGFYGVSFPGCLLLSEGQVLQVLLSQRILHLEYSIMPQCLYLPRGPGGGGGMWGGGGINIFCFDMFMSCDDRLHAGFLHL